MPVDPRRRAAAAAAAAAAATADASSNDSTNSNGELIKSEATADTGEAGGSVAADHVPSSSSGQPPPPAADPTLSSTAAPPPLPPLPLAPQSTTTHQHQHRPILLQHEDEQEEEDEDVNMAYEAPGALGADSSSAAASAGTMTTAAAASLHHHPAQAQAAAAAALSQEERQLISRIITPSPFEQHNNAGSNRFRNALTRVSNDPTGDAEAWQVIVGEASACYRTILDVHAVDAETLAQLDWVESCYGALLQSFPYAAPHVAGIAELLFAQSARFGEEHGPVHSYYSAGGASRRSVRCEAKLEALLAGALGVDFADGTVQPAAPSAGGSDKTESHSPPASIAPAEALGGRCDWHCDLWLTYVAKAARDAQRRVADEDQRAKRVRDATVAAYELAVARAGFGHNNHALWKQYLAYVKSWTGAAPGQGGNGSSMMMVLDHALQQQQMVQLRSVYQRLISIPMVGLDSLWQEYEAFERSHSEALAAALLAELTPKYQHARTIYLERTRVYGGPELIASGRTLATDPVHHREGSSSSSAAGAAAQKQAAAGDDKAGDGQEDSSAARLEEEHRLLKAWKVRCAYERTNPERLTSKELHQRCASAYRELVCAWTRHPESWHMWSMYELTQHHPQPSASTAGATKPAPASGSLRALAVLQLAQVHIPDCTLLAFAEARMVETHTDQPSRCIQVMETFIERSPNTLAFVLCQRMVRRYHEAEAARAVFARARRVLADEPSDRTATGPAAAAKRKSVVVDASAIAEENEDDEAQTMMAAEAAAATAPKEETNHTKKDWTVTNRLDESIQPSMYPPAGTHPVQKGGADASSIAIKPPVTWHLYVSHALIEHRLNRMPDVAARVYELGLRKHASFLTKPGYVSCYAQLLLELGDPVNLRALLTRSIAACEEAATAAAAAASASQESNPRGAASSASAALPVLWDLYLRFESVLSGGDPLGATRLQEIERKRREVVMGSDVEDVATGGLLSTSDVPLIGAQKSTISEQLVRSEGYDVSSGIVSGMSRVVDLLETMGLWGNDSASLTLSARAGRQDKDLDLSGGISDASYHKRLRFQAMTASGYSVESAAMDGGVGVKHLSARERMQQGAAGASAMAAGQPTAMMLAIQQSPEWLRPLLLLLPASRLRLPIVSKPPLHMTELALNSLRVNQLPAERPADTNGSNKRRAVNGAGGPGGGDSSDEEDVSAGPGYGDLFRSRQRARLMANSMAD